MPKSEESEKICCIQNFWTSKRPGLPFSFCLFGLKIISRNHFSYFLVFGCLITGKNIFRGKIIYTNRCKTTSAVRKKSCSPPCHDDNICFLKQKHSQHQRAHSTEFKRPSTGSSRIHSPIIYHLSHQRYDNSLLINNNDNSVCFF